MYAVGLTAKAFMEDRITSQSLKKKTFQNAGVDDGEKHRIFQSNDIVRHFKGNLYRIITIARNTETEELEVIYESLHSSSDDGKHEVWARPYAMFESKVDREKYPNATQEYRMEIVQSSK